MNPTEFFLLLTIVILYIGYFFILPVLSRSNYSTEDDQDILNTALYKKKLAELKSDLTAGTIEQAEFTNAERELKLQLLSEASVNPDKVFTSPESLSYRMVLLLVLAIPAVSAALYIMLGHPEAYIQGAATKNPHGIASNPHTGVSNRSTRKPASTASAPQITPHISAANLKNMELELETKPNDPTLLFALARAYQQRRQYAKSASLYKRILERIPKTHRLGKSFATFMAGYADVLASSLNGKLEGEPIKIVFKALEAFPEHPMSLHLAGTYYFRKGDYKGALKFWEKLHKVSSKSPGFARQIMASINLARKKLAETNGTADKPTPATAETTVKPRPATTNNAVFSISGTISIDPALKFTPTASSYLFVFAKQVNGPPRPLAALKVSNINYPYHFILDDNNLIIKGRSLKDLMPLVLTARITKSANALDREGSVVGSITVSGTSTKNIKIIINKR